MQNKNKEDSKTLFYETACSHENLYFYIYHKYDQLNYTNIIVRCLKIVLRIYKKDSSYKI